MLLAAFHYVSFMAKAMLELSMHELQAEFKIRMTLRLESYMNGGLPAGQSQSRLKGALVLDRAAAGRIGRGS